MFDKIKKTCDALVLQFDTIPNDRKALLEEISNYIQNKKNRNEAIQLMYICTHNSRRSHFGQIWAAVASDYFNIQNVTTFSGGTETTAFHINAINALKELGFKIQLKTESSNPIHEVFYSETKEPCFCFSKKYDDEFNPISNFAALMTCGDAEENCPFIAGVELRIGTTYNDPKEYDGTALQDQKYRERSFQIALETLFVFSKIK
ncbi:MAG: protein-tyrosine-phosphatase [Flavobacteriia bacterium]|nr:protein-tyrosine-phosphatase [Flavobacteriia bacterium]